MPPVLHERLLLPIGARHFPQALSFLLNCRDWRVRYYRYSQSARALRFKWSAPNTITQRTLRYVETMSLNRTKALLAAWMLVLLGQVPAGGQGLRDMQIFAPAELSTYGGGKRANEGVFFQFEGLSWSISKPQETPIGFPTTRRVVLFEIPNPDPNPNLRPKSDEHNTHTTGELGSDFTNGLRYEFGFVSGHCGWLLGGFRLANQNQRITASDMSVVFEDDYLGTTGENLLEGYIDGALTTMDDLPVRFTEATIRNQVQTWGLELMYMYRMHPNHHGGIFDLFVGARYLELDDHFNVEALGGTLDQSYWDTSAENHIIGPQIGARWFKTTRRWTWSTQGRFFAGLNSQNLSQRGALGTELDPINAGLLEIKNMPPSQFNHWRHRSEWSPGAELRVDFAYQLTRAISLQVGWTGFWIDGIARASNVIDYRTRDGGNHMGIDTTGNRQYVFMNGVTFGVLLNR